MMMVVAVMLMSNLSMEMARVVRMLPVMPVYVSG